MYASTSGPPVLSPLEAHCDPGCRHHFAKSLSEVVRTVATGVLTMVARNEWLLHRCNTGVSQRKLPSFARITHMIVSPHHTALSYGRSTPPPVSAAYALTTSWKTDNIATTLVLRIGHVFNHRTIRRRSSSLVAHLSAYYVSQYPAVSPR
ncbi:hypothetical protein LshimejAT787_1900130 [Lyophyllum shimeji]|uniref:Uncharacterized protein n=1 Tax=Lyophyllum shimeji TaxID=47721 RepID=A0A9P3UUN5_LYOSH|nr:hypothetical protein LshimejAT787_1900130 [Lyophyllum shimeji]